MPLLDTWVWAAYFQGGPLAERLVPLVEGPGVATSILTLAELADIHERSTTPRLAENAAFIASRGPVLEISPQAALRAGGTKWRQRRARREMGIADAIIYETAREHGLELVTGDSGFKGLEGVRLISTKAR
ncbi:MAG: PIN domain-containing protein [Candidatus Thermoplasmatota archaeon]|mgnify:CR=1 FL=1